MDCSGIRMKIFGVNSSPVRTGMKIFGVNSSPVRTGMKIFGIPHFRAAWSPSEAEILSPRRGSGQILGWKARISAANRWIFPGSGMQGAMLPLHVGDEARWERQAGR